ncbi:hypothetical protein F1C10_07155 [Sphingomonas sp. NBWT7]|uniref:hypothetical protein n=1 Tax=Sphingomonas sp. NBWT7 TaxID=2596913 RepID=UPI0016258404|nr:hypothetical protein [Sphingomonas sp. NBWT7]QNE31734.1 hypothetical protein F1C10_07155 [Sphingomonas sp. NBWT7]
MLFTTPTQWLALAIALIAGWLFGLASHPGGRKWKQRYAEERDVHGRTRKDYDTRLAERDARVVELERENARLLSAAPVAAPAVAVPNAAAPHAPIAQSAARPAGTRARWFDWNNRIGTNG